MICRLSFGFLSEFCICTYVYRYRSRVPKQSICNTMCQNDVMRCIAMTLSVNTSSAREVVRLRHVGYAGLLWEKKETTLNSVIFFWKQSKPVRNMKNKWIKACQNAHLDSRVRVYWHQSYKWLHPSSCAANIRRMTIYIISIYPIQVDNNPTFGKCQKPFSFS